MTSRSDRGPAPASRVVTSLTNDRVKLIRSLDMRKARRETGLFVAEGASVLMAARDNGWQPRILVHGAEARDIAAHRNLIDWALREGTEGLEVSRAILEKLAAKENPQNLMGVFEQRWSALPEVGTLALRRAAPRHVPAGNEFGLRYRPRTDGALLLPARQEGLSRPVILQ